jgi:thiol-disulfide isomerase/thioredoxin
MRTLNRFITVFSLTAAVAIAASAQTNLTGVDGTRVDIQGQRGKVVVLAVGACWLPLSAKQAEYTNSLAKKYAGKDVVFYFIATDSSNTKSKNFADDAAVKKFAYQNKMGVTVLRDFDGAATLRRFKIEQVPSFVILDKNGVPSGEPFGGISTDPKFDPTVLLARAIDKLL